MESLRQKLFKGLITEEEYRKHAILTTITALTEQQKYEFRSKLGVGSFGAVAEMFDPVNRKNVAAKIVLREYVTESEKTIWPSLKHENILSLLSSREIPAAYTNVFITEKHAGAMDDLLKEPSFSLDINSLPRALSWLRGICKGINYLHQQKLCHLDIKLGNVLISESDSALVCDFGSLTRTEAATNNYISPFTYRAPEAVILPNGTKVIVDGFKYDVYTLGILTLELLTKEAVYKSMDWNNDKNPNWIDNVYPKVFEALEKKKFEDAVRKNFLMVEIDRKTLAVMRNFVRACMSFNPQNRPTASELLEHKMFGGSLIFPESRNDIWAKRTPVKKMQFLQSLYVGKAAALGFPSSTPQSDDGCVDGKNFNPVPRNNDSSEQREHVVNDETEQRMSKRKTIRLWINRKSSDLSKAWNRLSSVFRRTRK